MNTADLTPEQAWRMVLDQLRAEMSLTLFNTWVRDTEFLSFENSILRIGTFNSYGCEWLTSRLTNTVSRMFGGYLNQLATVQFVVRDQINIEESEPEEEDSLPEEIPEKGKPPEELILQAEYQSIYDEIVQPEQVIVIPGYFLRYIPMLGLELSWLYIGFRQAAYESGASKKPGKKVGAPAKKVAGYAGMSPRSFWRWAAKPNTWRILRWLVKPVEESPKWNRGSDGRPHQPTRYYKVAMTMPLNPFDESSLRTWLYRKLGEGIGSLAALRTALETPVDELLPWPEKMPSMEDIAGEPHSIRDVVQEVCSPVAEGDRAQFNELTQKLAHHLMPSNDLVFLTHYFVNHWLPRLGSGPGWFVTMMRDRCYLNQRTGEIRDEVRLDEGYAEAARWLGLKRVKTIWEWLRNEDVATFLRETGREIGSWEEAPRRIKVCLGEPMTDEDQDRANAFLAKNLIGASVTHSEVNGAGDIGASCKKGCDSKDQSNGASDTHRDSVSSDPVGASVTHKDGQVEVAIGASGKQPQNPPDGPVGASVIHNETNDGDAVGASDTHIGATGTHKRGASVTDIGAIGTHTRGASGTLDWRDWHSLNSLTPNFKHLKNTQTTPEGERCENKKGVVAAEWKIEDLLSLNRISPKNQELLLGKGVTAQAFISWLLLAASKAGNGIRNPVGHAVSRLAQDPTIGAGGVYDRLAGLSAKELTELLHGELKGQGSWNTTWKTAMEDTPRTRLRALSYQLGVPVPDPKYW